MVGIVEYIDHIIVVDWSYFPYIFIAMLQIGNFSIFIILIFWLFANLPNLDFRLYFIVIRFDD